jgi:hypothetical protein
MMTVPGFNLVEYIDDLVDTGVPRKKAVVKARLEMERRKKVFENSRVKHSNRRAKLGSKAIPV